MKRFSFDTLLSYLMLGLLLVFFVLGLFIFSYVLLAGAVIGLVLFAVAYLRAKFFIHRYQKKHPPQPQGRIIDQEPEEK